MMLYHRNRLIRPYVKLGCQTKVQVSAFFWQPVSAFFCRLTWAIRTMCKSLPSSQNLSGLLDHSTSVCLFCRPSIFRQHFLPSSENLSVPFLWTQQAELSVRTISLCQRQQEFLSVCDSNGYESVSVRGISLCQSRVLVHASQGYQSVSVRGISPCQGYQSVSVRAISPCQSGVLVCVGGEGGVIVGVNQGYQSVSEGVLVRVSQGYWSVSEGVLVRVREGINPCQLGV